MRFWRLAAHPSWGQESCWDGSVQPAPWPTQGHPSILRVRRQSGNVAAGGRHSSEPLEGPFRRKRDDSSFFFWRGKEKKVSQSLCNRLRKPPHTMSISDMRISPITSWLQGVSPSAPPALRLSRENHRKPSLRCSQEWTSIASAMLVPPSFGGLPGHSSREPSRAG